MRKAFLYCLLFTLSVSGFRSETAAQIFTNSDFELGTNAGCDCPTGYTCANDAGRVVDGIHPLFTVGNQGCVSSVTNYTNPLGAHSGTGYVYYYAGADNVTTPNFNFSGGETIELCVWYCGPQNSGAPGQNTANSHFSFGIDGIQTGPDQTVPVNTPWTQFCYTITATPGSHNFSILSGGAAQYSIWFDDFFVTDLSNPPCTTSVTSTQNLSICSNDSIFVGGNWQNTPGTYVDTLTAADGCDSIINSTLTVFPVPAVSQSFSICTGDSMFLEGGWQTSSGVYYDTLTAGNGCDSIITSSLNVQAAITVSQTFSLCNGDSIFIAGSWQYSSGIFYDTIPGANGCDSIITSVLSFFQDTFYSQNIGICSGDSIFAGGAWQNSTGTFYDTLTTSNGCDSIVESVLNVIEPDSSSQVFSICTGDSIFIGGNWQFTAGIYYDTLASSYGCDSIVASSLIVNPLPLAVLYPGDTAICEGEQIVLSASGGNSYQWNTGAADSSITALLFSSSAFTVTVTNNCGSSFDSIQISVFPAPLASAGNDITISQGSTAQLTASGGNSFLWNTGETGPAIYVSPLTSASYSVTVTDSNNCSNVASVNVNVDIHYEVSIPTIFSPNGDGINDVVSVKGLNIQQFRLIIYDRWGEKIFETGDKGKSWDGTRRGKALNSGVFVYILTGNFTNEEEFYQRGNITLIK